MKNFYQLLINHFASVITTNLMWFALSLWVYVQTNSVLATSIMYGIYMVAIALTGMWFGSLVDHHKKKTMMIISNVITLATFVGGFLLYLFLPQEVFTSYKSFYLWLLVFLVFAGVIVSNIRSIALPTLTTFLVPEEHRDKANGLSGTVNGLSFLIASVISGFLLATSGMFWIMIISISLLSVAIIHLFFLPISENKIIQTETEEGTSTKFNPKATFKTILAIPGLLGLIFFNTFNNFLGGVFMPLLDPYGLSLVSLQVWGVLWGFLSLGFIVGGVYVAKKGLGPSPLRTLFISNIVMWVTCIFFAIQPSIILLVIGIFIWLCISPFIEASEQTIIQKIVPAQKQGRVFGFAQSVEMSASPIMTLMIGPITQFFFIPFMTTGLGVKAIGSWFGVGEGRGIGLVFTLAGLIGLIITLWVMRSRSYKLLSKEYAA